MNLNINEHISWWEMVALKWHSLEKTFEFLCADFMKIKYNLDRVPLPSQNDIFPWIEWEPIEKDWLYYWYQAKFWNDAFNNNKWFDKSFTTTSNSIKDWVYTLSILCLFSRKDYPTKNRKIKEQKFTKFENDNNLKLHKYFWNDFLSELKKQCYIEILYKYFPIDSIKKEIYEKCENKKEVCEISLNNDINNVINLFEWDSNYYKNDLEIAKIIQKKYSYKKLSFSSKIYILETFDELENEIANKIFDEISFYNFSKLDDYLETWKKLLEDSNSLKKYSVELENLIENKRWIFINYWKQWICKLNYISENEIKFKDKRYGWNI